LYFLLIKNIVDFRKEQRQLEERQRARPRPASSKPNYKLSKWFLNIMTPKSLMMTTAVSIVVGICAYYYKNQYLAAGIS